MAWDFLLQQLVYILTFIGTFVEGEMTLMTSSYNAALGNLNIWVVFIIGLLGVLCADNWWFFVGKKYGTKFIDSHAHLKKRAALVQRLLERNQLLVVILYRYAWGFRTVTPIILGTTHITRKRFFAYTLITIPIWAIIFTSIGYKLGSHLTVAIAYVHSIQIAIFFIVVIWLSVYLYKKYEQQLKAHVKKSVVASKNIHQKIKQNVQKIHAHTKKTREKLVSIGNRRLFKQKRMK